MLAASLLGPGVGVPRGVHVGEGPGRGRAVGAGGDDGSRAGPAHDEPRGGELVVRRDDRAAGQAQHPRERPGGGQRVARAQPAGPQLGDDRVGQPVAQRGRTGGDVEHEVDGAGGARHPTTILVL